MTILDALSDANLFAPLFRPAASWAAWRAFLAAVFGLPMTPAEQRRFTQHTGRTTPPTRSAREAWVVVGRRGGKSRVSALLVTFLACFRQYHLAPGERGVAMVIAADRRQARVVFRYISGIIDAVPMLKALVEHRTNEALHLTNGISIEVHTASFRAVRGYTVVAVVLDEVAYWPTDESANPDAEIIAALRPGMASVPTALLVAISSPYARRGELWRAYEQHYGCAGDPVLVWQADTRSMNPSVDPVIIAAAYEDDPNRAAAEYGAEFRRDVEGYVSRETVAACIVADRHELPPATGVQYVAFTDPSGGSADSFTLGIAHREGDRIVLDVLRDRRPPFSPDDVVAEYAATAKLYRCTTVHGDRYGGEWPRERFRSRGITYATSTRTKSELYATLLPLLNAQRVDLIDDRRLFAQLIGLERRTARGGRESIDHGPGAHDDAVNAAAGALVLASERREIDYRRVFGSGRRRVVPIDPMAAFLNQP
jgi:hypothetical protein